MNKSKKKVEKKTKYTLVTVRLNDVQVDMVDNLVVVQGYRSRPSVLEDALRLLYKKNFPSYASLKGLKKTARDDEESDAFLTSATIKRKVEKKAEETQILNQELVAYGRLIATKYFPRGEVVGVEGGIKTARISYKRVSENKLVKSLLEIPVRELPSTTGSWHESEQLRRYILRYVFTGIRWDQEGGNEIVFKDSIRMVCDNLVVGLEQGNYLVGDDIPSVLFSGLLDIVDKSGVSLSREIKETLKECADSPAI